jgi:ABC-type sulfate/molybdate transport systems ATPase subunit
MNYLTNLHRQGLTVVIVTHDVLLAANYSQRIIVMRSGSVALDGTPNEIFHNSDLLRRCSIVPPAVAQLSVSLGMTEFTCRVDEMVESFAGGVDGDGR